MPTTLKVPRLGEDVQEAEVVTVLVAPGDTITVGQVLVELETGKAAVEIPSEAAGVVSEVTVTAGAKVKPGDPLVVLEGEKAAGRPTAESKGGEQAAEKVAVKKPRPKSPGGRPGKTDRGRRPAPAPDATATTNRAAVAAPSVRRLARELGVDLATVAVGPDGRVTAAAVEAAAKAAPRSAATAPADGKATADGGGSQGAAAAGPPATRHPLNANRRRIAAAMTRSWTTIPQVVQHAEADLTGLDRLHRDFKQAIVERGGHPGLIAPLALAVALTLKRHPDFNAAYDAAAGELVRYDRVDLGIAMITDRGLVVPVLRDAAGRTLVELAGDVAALLERGRRGSFTEADLTGATCTLSNLGGAGAGHFTPIIVPGQVAIVGLGRATLKPWVVDGALEPRLVLPVSVSYDHRVLDGVAGATFATDLVAELEDPRRILLGV